MMALHEGEFTMSEDFIERFTMPDEIWDTLASVTTATAWDEIPFHPKHDTNCTVCDKFRR